MILNNPEVISSIIQTIGTIISTLIGSIAVFLIGKKFEKQEKLKADLNQALNDINFLLQVEELHCNKHKDREGESYKNRIRDEVRKLGLDWSGQFTKSKIRNKKGDL